MIARWPHDGVKSIDYPGGVRREVDYDVRGPVSEIRIKPPSGTPLIEKWTYSYTDVLNVETMTDAAARVTTYGYDALDRLISADHPQMPPPLDGLPDLETFTYDGVGDRTMSGYAHDANHRMRASPGHSYDYDDDGNLVVRDPNTAGQATYSWDTSNRLTGFASGSVAASYAYDPFGRRIRKALAGATTWSLWRRDRLAAEYESPGDRITWLAHGEDWSPEEVGFGSSSEMESRLLVENDQLGTPRLLLDASGEVKWRAVYAAYGGGFVDPDPDGDSQQTTFNARLPGQQLDSETTLHYNRFRYYDSGRGDYVQADPLGQRGGLDLYAYAQLDPIRLIDPTGLTCCRGRARVLQGNADHIGKAGGLGGSRDPIAINASSAVIIPEQWGGKAAARAIHDSVSGSSTDGTPLFDNLADVVGGDSPDPHVNVRDWLMEHNPNALIIELPGGRDLGTIDVNVNVPVGVPCPKGTSPVPCKAAACDSDKGAAP